MKTITIWSDFACPYCYIGERRLKDAIHEMGVDHEIKIDYRAFELDPNAPIHPKGNTVERMAAKYGISIEQAQKQVDTIDHLGKELGIDFKFATAKSSNTFDAHLLMKFAQSAYEPEVVEALNEALFDAYFVKNEVLADRKVLLKIVENVGMDPVQAKEVLDQKLYANDVRYDEQEAASRGVHGVPYMVFDGEFAVPGAISTADCKKALRDILSRVKEKPTGLNPKTCDENGCKI